jgi:hypothetical protein
MWKWIGYPRSLATAQNGSYDSSQYGVSGNASNRNARIPGSFAARFISSSASSLFWNGTVAGPINRSGACDANSERKLL